MECTNCLMNDKVDVDIQFNEDGVCNYCQDYYVAREHAKARIAENYFHNQIQAIKHAKRSQYDCILGISGGTDSSYTAYLLKKEGLNVLLVHCDNGWDTETAVSNLMKIKEKTGFDLLVRKVDTEAFYAAQKSFLKARVIDIELLSDHVNVASIYEVAYEKKISWIATGENMNTEFVMPRHWVHNKNDLRHIKAINNLFEKADISSFPKLGPFKKYFIDKRLGIHYFKPLNCINYNKEEARTILEEEFDWEDHGGKHFESFFTIFFQCYILPEFFNVDKRIPHLSNLICSGVISKEDAQKRMLEPILTEEKLKEVKDYVLEKLKLTTDEFEAIMAKPVSSHADYKSHYVYNKNIQRLVRLIR